MHKTQLMLNVIQSEVELTRNLRSEIESIGQKEISTMTLITIARNLGCAITPEIEVGMEELAKDPDNQLYNAHGFCTSCGYYHDDVCTGMEDLAFEVFETAMLSLANKS